VQLLYALGKFTNRSRLFGSEITHLIGQRNNAGKLFGDLFADSLLAVGRRRQSVRFDGRSGNKFAYRLKGTLSFFVCRSAAGGGPHSSADQLDDRPSVILRARTERIDFACDDGESFKA